MPMEDVIAPITGFLKDARPGAGWLSREGDVDMSRSHGTSTDSRDALALRVSGLEAAIDSLSRRLTTLRDEQHTHCDHIANVYVDLEKLLRDHYPVDLAGARRHARGLQTHTSPTYNGNATPPSAAPAEAPLPPTAVVNLLENFRGELQRQAQRSDARLDELRTAIDDVRSIALARTESQQELERAITAALEEVRRIPAPPPPLAPVVAPPTLSAEQVDEITERVREALMTDIHRNRKEHLQSFDRRLGKAEKEVYREIDKRCAKAALSAEQKAERLVRECAQSRDNDTVEMSASVRRVEEELRALIESMSSVKTRTDMVARDTQFHHEARTRETRELRERVAGLETVVHEQARALQTLVNENALDGAFIELKDWLLDLEKRAMSRGEMLELNSRFETQLAELHRDLHSLATIVEQMQTREVTRLGEEG